MVSEIRKKEINSFLSLEEGKKISLKYNVSLKRVEKIALNDGITPLRYKKNQTTISVKSQLELLSSHVAIIGCGGLGGHVAEILARVGIGELSLFDFDSFDETNLNRQNFATTENIKKRKVDVLKLAISKINPSTTVNTFVMKFDPIKDFNKIEKVNVVVDGLDDPATKLNLAKICKNRNIDFVHGAVGGMSGQFSTNSTLEKLYKENSFGVEKLAGSPSFSVTFAASIQSSEVIKTLIFKEKRTEQSALLSDLLYNEFVIIDAI